MWCGVGIWAEEDEIRAGAATRENSGRKLHIREKREGAKKTNAPAEDQGARRTVGDGVRKSRRRVSDFRK
jgi:hypothetical protein